MNSANHSIRFAASDWQTLQDLAQQRGLSVNQLINQLCGQFAGDNGKDWQGNKPRGYNRFSVKKS